MILLWNAVVLEVRVQAHTQKFWFAENLGKIPENPVKNGTQRCQGLQKNTWRPFSEVTPKNVFMIFVGEQLQVKVAQITFWASLRKCGQKSFGQKIAPPKCACSYTYDENTSPPSLPPFLKEQKGKCPRHASILRRLCAYYSTRTLFTRCKLRSVTVTNINYYQQYP